jgi:hypothetical protein
MRRKHIYFDKQPADEFEDDLRFVIKPFKQTLLSGDYIAVYGPLQFLIRADKHFAAPIQKILEHERAPYRVVDDTLFPVASDSDAQNFEQAFKDLTKSGLTGARTHLKDAAHKLSTRDFPGSVRESVHAVESVARALQPSAQLSSALAELEQ